MKIAEKTELIVEALEKAYPEAVCSLVYEKPYELLIATMLSAQCTDARVNIVTKELFSAYTTLESIAAAEPDEIAEYIKSCGLYRSKAKNIVSAAKMLVSQYGGELPDSIDELTKLPGVGRKTANLIMGDIWKKPAIVTDTHFIRITGRLGLTSNKEPAKVEKDLIPLIPAERSSDFCHRIVLFGREYCKARNPLCDKCPLSYFCKYK
jgi:endonuclease-3